MTKSYAPTFVVDKVGLAKLLRRRPIGSVVLELLQNAWDEDVRQVDVTLSYRYGKATVRVEDDAPEGFADLAHAYTLFAESTKKGDPTKRGRFNIGEKLVIAICETAEICTTKGTVVFSGQGRSHSRQFRLAGTVFTGVIHMTRAEFDEMLAAVRRALPPADIATTLNGELLAVREPLATFQTVLPTEISDADGYLKRGTWRKTSISIYGPQPDESVTLYELGIPVVETGDTWHVDIGQKVPLNSDRDNVTPSYLHQVRTAVLNHMAEQLPKESSTATWVGSALESYAVEPAAVIAIIEARFGPKRVITDPSDREAEKRAMAAGYTVISGGAFNAAQWENIRKAGAALPAGKVTPSPKPFSLDGKPLKTVPPDQWPKGVATAVARLEEIGTGLICEGECSIVVANDRGWPFNAACGADRTLYLNVARLGWAWFAELAERQLSLLIHELAHVRVSDHLSDKYADELCKLGARLTILISERPSLLRL